MTITIEIPARPGEALRALLTLAEPVALALAAACGAGPLTQFLLDAALRLARRALTA
jgi:uncharacterized protein (DUF1778 family)